MRGQIFSTLSFMILAAAFVSAHSSTSGDSREHQRKGKLFSAFQIVRFANSACNSTSSKIGTCYTSEECKQRSGQSAGSCADGFGVCCVVTIGCGDRSSENCTYFDSSAPGAGACSVSICPCGDSICQLRLDLDTFVVSGPSESTASDAVTLNGAPVKTGVLQALRGQCLTDAFAVTNPGGSAPPVICGTNSGEHMYVDASSGCNDLAFTLGSATAVAARSWSIKVTQYSCSFPNLAPSGCTQYFFGPTTGQVQTFNFNNANGQHLANQRQNICIRRERGLCRICYAAAANDFLVSGGTANNDAITGTSTCCGYADEGILGYDCLYVNAAVTNTASNMVVTANRCGGTLTTVCSITAPFLLSFRSNAFEAVSDATAEANERQQGFRITYTMDTQC